MRRARVLFLCLLPSLAAAQPVQVLHEFPKSPPTPDGARVRPDGAPVPMADASPYGMASDGIEKVAAGGIVVESLGPSPVPIVVELATDTSPGGVAWRSGGNALAAPVP